MKKALQTFSDERLEQDKSLTPTQIAQFLEDFRNQFHKHSKSSKLISLRINEDILSTFKDECAKNNIKYQKKIKELMLEWLLGNSR